MTREAAQLIYDRFTAAVDKAAAVKALMLGRPVGSIAECVGKLVAAERQHALHILAAADRALESLAQ
jgi:hypothetical protein